MDSSPAIEIAGLCHAYGERRALRELSLVVPRGEIFGLLGPNGGGKTTLFRVLSTLVPLQSGSVRILGCDLRGDRTAVRARIGVVFQAPSLDKKLTVRENLWHQAALYGLRGNEFRERSAELLRQLGLTDRADDRTEALSGGLRRRVELAKGLLHRPELLLLDEPSTGLDPGARLDLWACLRRLRDEHGVTIVLTTHLLDEAEQASRLGILADGRLVALGAPDALRAEVGGDTVAIAAEAPAELAAELRRRWELPAHVVDGGVRLEMPDARRWVARIMDEFPQRVTAITVGRPTLEDVFIARTGRRFWQAAESPE